MTKKEIDLIIKFGQKIQTSVCSIYIGGSEGISEEEVVCMVSKKVQKKAVGRHRMQRLMREVARQARSNFSISGDMVWVAISDFSKNFSMNDLKKIVFSALETGLIESNFKEESV